MKKEFKGKSAHKVEIRLWSSEHFNTKPKGMDKRLLNVFDGYFENVDGKAVTKKEDIYFHSPGEFLKKLQKIYWEKEKEAKK